MVGEAQLQEALSDVTHTWSERYGTNYTDAHRNAVPGARDDDCVSVLGEGQYGCLLRGTAMFVRDWTGPAGGGLAAGERAQLVAVGAAGSHVATLRLTLATADGIDESQRRDL